MRQEEAVSSPSLRLQWTGGCPPTRGAICFTGSRGSKCMLIQKYFCRHARQAAGSQPGPLGCARVTSLRDVLLRAGYCARSWACQSSAFRTYSLRREVDIHEIALEMNVRWWP